MEMDPLSDPFGLKSLVECIFRAIYFSQPNDMGDFIHQYITDLMNYIGLHQEKSLKLLFVVFQEQWEMKFLASKDAIKRLDSVPSLQNISETEIEDLLQKLYMDLAMANVLPNEVVHRNEQNQKTRRESEDNKCVVNFQMDLVSKQDEEMLPSAEPRVPSSPRQKSLLSPTSPRKEPVLTPSPPRKEPVLTPSPPRKERVLTPSPPRKVRVLTPSPSRKVSIDEGRRKTPDGAHRRISKNKTPEPEKTRSVSRATSDKSKGESFGPRKSGPDTKPKQNEPKKTRAPSFTSPQRPRSTKSEPPTRSSKESKLPRLGFSQASGPRKSDRSQSSLTILENAGAVSRVASRLCGPKRSKLGPMSSLPEVRRTRLSLHRLYGADRPKTAGAETKIKPKQPWKDTLSDPPTREGPARVLWMDRERVKPVHNRKHWNIPSTILF